ncbi:MAG: hypothetical protein EP330_13050 [Deltaproteobacteria bacterium]|nr:MAG: hypothetical protein EP330_13050 [Deltaproteobacteria bacterium]
MLVLLTALAMAHDPAALDEQTAEAAARYRVALDLVDARQYGEACEVLREVESSFATTEYAGKAADLRQTTSMVAKVCADGVSGSQEDGTVELVVSQALLGPVFFGTLGGAVSPGSAAAPLTGGLLGLGVGIGAPLLIGSRYGITEGQAMTVYTGELAGTLGAAVALEVLRPSEPRDNLLILAGGFATGMVGGAVGAIVLPPNSGDASMVRSGLSWGAGYGALTLLLTQGRAVPNIAAGAGIGMLAMGVTAFQVDISRRRMNLINLSGYAGALTGGLGLALFALGSEVSPQVGFSVVGGLSAVGLGLGTYLTRDYDGATLARLEGDRSSVVVHMPTVSPRIDRDGLAGADVRLLSGTW